MREPGTVKVGDAEAALAGGVKVDQVYDTPRHSHAALSPHAATVCGTATN